MRPKLDLLLSCDNAHRSPPYSKGEWGGAYPKGEGGGTYPKGEGGGTYPKGEGGGAHPKGEGGWGIPQGGRGWGGAYPYLPLRIIVEQHAEMAGDSIVWEDLHRDIPRVEMVCDLG